MDVRVMADIVGISMYLDNKRQSLPRVDCGSVVFTLAAREGEVCPSDAHTQGGKQRPLNQLTFKLINIQTPDPDVHVCIYSFKFAQPKPV